MLFSATRVHLPTISALSDTIHFIDYRAKTATYLFVEHAGRFAQLPGPAIPQLTLPLPLSEPQTFVHFGKLPPEGLQELEILEKGAGAPVERPCCPPFCPQLFSPITAKQLASLFQRHRVSVPRRSVR